MGVLCFLAGAVGCGGREGAAESSPSSAPSADGVRYAHLGDSFAAGSGIDPIVEDSPAMCLRSQRNFGRLVAQRRGIAPADFADVSCGGATTANLTVEQYQGVPPQVEALGPATELVTIMIGGNDGKLFADAVAGCVEIAQQDLAGDPCRRGYGAQFDDEVDETTGPALREAIGLLVRRAPGARILVVGYPRLLPRRTGCYPTMPLATGDVAYLNELQESLNRAIAGAARAHGATFVDLWRASAGHDACAAPDQRWIEPLRGSRIRTTVHPNAAGQRAMAGAVLAALG
ncbi:putative esterase [Gordonia araii NBRC 100433]|uniref:Putative esterase n=2 Tax=Gordonia araii TaxID=263909 RepID=G7H1D0_9ACTN|nr:SGNH/GDSL hydrolase family protein [Gordonia araii]NNG97837.1 SGNH/GDSL hydrolase family protein [Gordonia araii NBRC 100433]GAB09655.1 putative esterase [Gordonia araii NBRC 100433]